MLKNIVYRFCFLVLIYLHYLTRLYQKTYNKYVLRVTYNQNKGEHYE